MKTAVRESRAGTASPPEAGLVGCVRGAAAVLAKDIRCELRTRHAITSVLLFAVTSTVAVSFTLNAWGAGSAVAAGLLWIVIYFSAMSGLSRSFVREEEMFTSSILKLTVAPNSVYLGKLAFNFGMLIAVEAVAVPLFLVLMGCGVVGWGPFTALLVTGSLALSAGATMSAAVVAKAANRGALYAVISFPLLIPVLALAIHGSDIAIGNRAAAGAWTDARLLVYYCGVVIPASLMLFRHIWED